MPTKFTKDFIPRKFSFCNRKFMELNQYFFISFPDLCFHLFYPLLVLINFNHLIVSLRVFLNKISFNIFKQIKMVTFRALSLNWARWNRRHWWRMILVIHGLRFHKSFLCKILKLTNYICLLRFLSDVLFQFIHQSAFRLRFLHCLFTESLICYLNYFLEIFVIDVCKIFLFLDILLACRHRCMQWRLLRINIFHY